MKDAAVKAVPGVSDDTPAQEFSRLVIEYNEGIKDSPERQEAWNLIADFALEHCDTIIRAMSPAALSAALPLASVEQGGLSSAEPVVIQGEGFAHGGFAVLYVNGKPYTPEQIAAAIAHPGAGQPAAVAVLPGDLFSHKDAWRRGLVRLRDTAEVVQPDIDDRSYWQHELDIFDAVFAALASGNDLRKRVVGNPYKANAEFREDTP